MTTNSKKLVVVDPYYDFLIDQLKKDGFELFAVFSEKREEKGYYKYHPANFTEIYEANTDYPIMLKKLRSETIRAVLLGFDTGFRIWLQLSQDLEIPDANSLDLKAVLGNKFKTTEYLKQKNVSIAKHILVHESDIDEMIAFASKEIDYPLIVKPTESSSSFGFHICHSSEDLEQRIHELLGMTDPYLINTIKELVIEEYLQGTEYAVCSVTERGQHAIPELCCTTRFLGITSLYSWN